MSKTVEVRELTVESSIGDQLEKWCEEPPVDVGRGETIFDEVIQFKDGHTMSIQAIASLEPDSEPIWTQGVLFFEGVEVGFTEAGDSFYGEYQVGNHACLVKPAL